MRSLMVLIIASSLAMPVAAQGDRKILSCPSADSVLGAPDKPKLSIRRDKLTDSVFFSTDEVVFGTDLLSQNYIRASFVLAGVASEDSHHLIPLFHVRARKGFKKGETISSDRVWLGDSIFVNFLLDDSLRFQIGPMPVSKTTKGQGVFKSAEINEEYWSSVSTGRLLDLARASKGRMGVRDKRSDTGNKLRQGTDAMIRVIMCEAWMP